MSLYTFSTSQKLPVISSAAGLRIEECTNVNLLALMGTTTVDDVVNRIANDHVAFVAYVHDSPAAFGWMARGKARIGELNHELILPIGHRYLWNFRTREEFRGLGIYPALLQHMIRYESARASQFWIIHAPENLSSLKGIIKAGFQFVGAVYANNETATIENNSTSRSLESLLNEMDVFISEQPPASCWNCSSPYLKKRSASCCCRPSGKA